MTKKGSRRKNFHAVNWLYGVLRSSRFWELCKILQGTYLGMLRVNVKEPILLCEGFRPYWRPGVKLGGVIQQYDYVVTRIIQRLKGLCKVFSSSTRCICNILLTVVNFFQMFRLFQQSECKQQLVFIELKCS